MLPRVVLFNSISLDGRMDWFKGDIGLYYGIAGRLNADAFLSGSNTILAGLSEAETNGQYDEDTVGPQPGERVENDHEPSAPAPEPQQIMVIVDSRGRIKNLHQFRQTPYWRDVVVLSSPTTPQTYLDYLRQHQIETIVTGEDQVDLRAALAELTARYGVQVVRVDSGGVLNGILLRAGLVDEVWVLVNPYLVGGTTARSIFVAPDVTSAEEIIDLKLLEVEEVTNGCVWLRYEVVKPSGM